MLRLACRLVGTRLNLPKSLDIAVAVEVEVEVFLLEEQIQEAERAEFSKEGPLLPHTYEYLKRLDRDLGLFGDPE